MTISVAFGDCAGGTPAFSIRAGETPALRPVLEKHNFQMPCLRSAFETALAVEKCVEGAVGIVGGGPRLAKFDRRVQIMLVVRCDLVDSGR